jgi:LAGLIDADG DNA endonuclease family
LNNSNNSDFFRNNSEFCLKNSEFFRKNTSTSPSTSKCKSKNKNKGKGRSEIKLNNNTNNSTTPLYQECGWAGHSPYSRSILKSSPIIQKREFHHKVKAKNRIGPHNIDTLSIILGSILGNGNMKKLVEGSMLVVKVTNKENALWFYKFFYNRGYTSNQQPRQITKTFISTEGTENSGYEFNTFTFRSFNWIHRIFYNNGRKVIPENIYEYLTPLALAVWIKDDGCIANSGIRLATNSLKVKELQLLQDVLKSKYNLETTIQNIYIKDQYSIYIKIKKKSVNNLRNIVGPYIQFSMLHKLG